MRGVVKMVFTRDRGFMIFLLAVGVFMIGFDFASARGAPQRVAEGNEAFQKGSFAEAAARYEDARKERPESPVPLFNLGVVLYEQGNFPAALTAFQSIEAENDELAPLIHYNQGNTLARMGKIEESENPREALEHYVKSVAAYKRVLSIDPGNRESAYNIEVVRTWIRDLEKKIGQTTAVDSSSRSSTEYQKRQKGRTSPGEQNEEPKAGQQEQDDEGDAFSQQPPAAPSVPQDERAVPRNETAQSILREEQLRREAESQIRGGLSENDRPTW